MLPADPAGRRCPRDTMGRVRRTRSSALWIFAGRVRQAISLDWVPSVRERFTDPADYSRTLGRVVAHELVHAIVPHEPHATRGLMQPSLNRTVLTSQRIAIDERFREAILREIASRSAINQVNEERLALSSSRRRRLLPCDLGHGDLQLTHVAGRRKQTL